MAEPATAPTLEVIDSSEALGALERSQIDMQIATAKKYPRSVKAFLEEAKTMIAINLETAEACNYKLKRKDKEGGTKVIEGPSIRLLEIAACAYGNLSFGSRIIGMDEDFVTAQGVAIDMEKNNRVFVETKRSIRSKHGRYSTDMIMVTANAAGSIARRNALLGGAIPRAYVMHLADYAKQVAVGDQKTMGERRQRAFDYFTKTLGVELAKVLAYVEKPSVEDCGLAEVEELQGLKTMLKENEMTIDEAFEPEKTQGKAESPDLGDKKQPEDKKPEEREPRKKKEKVEPKPADQEPAAAAATTPPPAAAATEPPQVETMGDPPAAPPETQPEPGTSPVLTLAGRLHEAGVLVDDFFDWLKGSGRDRTYGINIDKVQSLEDLPAKLVDDLLADEKAMASCIRTFGKKK